MSEKITNVLKQSLRAKVILIYSTSERALNIILRPVLEANPKQATLYMEASLKNCSEPMMSSFGGCLLCLPLTTSDGTIIS
jgi:hypothetical protein